MGNIYELLNSGANVAVTVSAADLREFFRATLDEWQAERDSWAAAHAKDSELLTIDATMARLGVKKCTLWRWEKSGYLTPVKIGRYNRYRLSDIERLEGGQGV